MHIDQSGEKCFIDIFEYLKSHFCLGNGETTPRVVLLYLEKVVSISAEYYNQNPDKASISKDENGEYPLILRELMMQAYFELQQDMAGIFKSSITNKDWQNMLDTFLCKKGRKTSFSFRSLKNMIGIDNNECMRDFLAYICHLGVMRCRDKSVILEQRHYDIPLILQGAHIKRENKASVVLGGVNH